MTRVEDPGAIRLAQGKTSCERPHCPVPASHILILHASNARLRLCTGHWHDALVEVESALQAGSVA